MPYSLSWSVSQRVLLYVTTGLITPQDHLALRDEMRRYLAEGHAPVHLISDSREVVWLGSIASSALNFDQYYDWLGDERLGHVLVVGSPRASEEKLVLALLARVGRTLDLFETVEAALAHLRALDPSLPADDDDSTA